MSFGSSLYGLDLLTILLINLSPNIYKEARKTTVPYCDTAPILCPLTNAGASVGFPHGLPYCFRLFSCFSGSEFRALESDVLMIPLFLFVIHKVI